MGTVADPRRAEPEFHVAATVQGMAARSYEQNCGLARAMDLLGERWTVILLRELGIGPRRYKDLSERLPGMGTNLLAARLKSLEETGVIRRVKLPAPASTHAYELTETGAELRPILGQLSVWGLRHGVPFDERDQTRAIWPVLSLFSTRGGMVLGQFAGVVQVNIGSETAWATATAPDDVQVREGPAPVPPRLVLTTTSEELIALLTDQVSIRDAVRRGTITIDGDPAAAEDFVRLYESTAA